MFFSFLALTVGILVGIMVLVVIFSLLTMARRSEAQAEKLFGMDWEEGWKNSKAMGGKVQTNQEPFEEVVRIPRCRVQGCRINLNEKNS